MQHMLVLEPILIFYLCGDAVHVGIGVDVDFFYIWSDAVHIGSGFLREGGWEVRRDPALEMDARRLTILGMTMEMAWLGYAVVGW
jgi:hypothetical protein